MDIETSSINTPADQAIETSSALDALMKNVTETPEADVTPAKETPAVIPAPDAKETPAPDAKEIPAADAKPKVEDKPAETPVVAAPKDALDEVQLPPYSKPKTGEAFDKVKALARETISKKETELAQLRKDLAERDEKLKGAPTPEQAKKLEEQTKELEELRNFRRASDIENDPVFKASYDGKIAANNKLIVSKLAENGMSKENLEAIEKLGGVEKIDWDPILPNLPPAIRHLVNAKLGNNIELRDERQAAIDAVRKDPSKFEVQRHEVQARTLTETANAFLVKMPWSAEKPVPANATPEQKTEIEAHNKIAKDTQALIKSALSDYSPELFAELAVGTAAAHKFKSDLTTLKASSEAAAAKYKTEIDTITKERDAIKAELASIKKAGRTHIRNGAAPTPAVTNVFATSGSDALDRLRDEAA